MTGPATGAVRSFYHGTTATAATKILRGQFLPSDKAEWLGTGVYFFSSARRAFEWNLDRKYVDPCILVSEISQESYVDLTDGRWKPIIAAAYEQIRDEHELAMTPLPQNRGTYRPLDHLVMNRFCEVLGQSWGPVDAIGSYFVEGDALYPGASLYTRGHLQIAVRNVSAILSTRRLSRTELERAIAAPVR